VRVFVTGLGGFVGGWLAAELRQAGHQVLPDARGHQQGVDVRDVDGLTQALLAARPEAVVHLAAISAAGEAAKDPEQAFEVAVGGTVNLLEGVGRLRSVSALLVVGSSEVYGAPTLDELPLGEDAPLRPRTPYALSKVAQESVALAYAARRQLPVGVARPFNHIGPGQRPAFVVPMLAERILRLRRGQARDISVGNLHVRRDFTDVRDVVRAYRLIIERLVDGSLASGVVLNVASGEAVSIRSVVELLCQAAGVPPVVRIDPALVRDDDPEEIRGDAGALRSVTGWRPQYSLQQTLGDVWRDVWDGVTHGARA
jgi:GDP-4-dehydro-6-deoxy-D-mannose reductase